PSATTPSCAPVRGAVDRPAALTRPTYRPLGGARAAARRSGASGAEMHRKGLQLVDEGRFDVDGAARDVDVGVAFEGLFEHDLQLEAGEGGAEAEVASAGAEGLVLFGARQIEAVGFREARLVAVGGDVPHHHL